MNAAELIKIIQKGNSLEKDDFRALIKLHETFPYFLVPKVLAAKYEKNISQGESKELLHWAAVQSPDRSWLKKLITEEIQFVTSSTEAVKTPPLAEEADSSSPVAIKQSTPAQDDNESDDTTKSATDHGSRAEILKKLEENLHKLKKQEPEKNTGEKDKAEEKNTDKPTASPAQNASKPVRKKKKTGDDLIETIMKKEKKVIKDAKKQEQIDIIKAFSKKEIKLATIKENEENNKIQDLSVQSTQLSD
ncbi:hypothetical protein, partial [Echinicola sediminis]